MNWNDKCGLISNHQGLTFKQQQNTSVTEYCALTPDNTVNKAVNKAAKHLVVGLLLVHLFRSV